MVPFVQSNQVVHVNGMDFAWPSNPNGVPGGMQIPTLGTQIIGSYWRIPQTQGPRVIGWTYLNADNTSVKPQPDALKILSLKLTGEGGVTNILIAITDTDNMPASTPPNQFAYLADGLGGTLPVMPTVTIPVPIMQQEAQIVDPSTGARTFIFALPVNPLGLLYTVNGIWFNGLAPTPAYVPTGITTPAGFAAYGTTNWSDYGTWTATGNIVKLVSPTTAVIPVTRAGIDIELTPKAYCFDLTAYSTPALVDGIRFGGTASIIPVTPFMLTDDPTVLLNVLKPKMSADTVFSTAVANKLGVSTVQDVPKVYAGAVLVETSTAGAC
jgi:hypothetical protein